ncbi:MAG: RNA methyltransferase [Polyangiales bacterium]
MSDERPFFATAAKGTEGVLRDELRSLRIRDVRADRGGVHFGRTLEDALRVCFCSRIAVRVLWRRGSFDASTPDALYEGVRAIDLSDVLTPAESLSVAATVKSGALTHSGFVGQKTKDALVDAQRAHFGKRSDVARDDPDVRVVVHVAKDHGELYLDVSGTPLHQRGYRTEAGPAPIKETLAAAMLRLAQWDGVRPLVDPMCGSGTIAIEGMLWAREMAPGLLGRKYGVQRWPLFGPGMKDALIALREQARARVRPEREAPTVMALDADPEVLAVAKRLAKRAGVNLAIDRLDVRDFAGTDPAGDVVTNPPYGVRIARGEGFDAQLAESFRALRGHRVTAICQDAQLAQAMRMKPSREHALWNGDLECRLFTWEP